MADEDAAQLPAKVNNDNAFRAAGPVQVRINAFRMDLGQAPEREYQYELRFIGEFPKGGKKGQQGQVDMRELARGPRNDECKETRRELHWCLFQMLLAQNQDFFTGDRRDYVYDCALLMYATHRLLPNGEKREFLLNTENLEQLSDRSRAYIRRCVRITAQLTATEQVDIRNVQVTEPGGDRSVCHFLELLTTQRMHEQNKHFIFGGNRMFKKDSNIQLQGDPRICKEGMQKNVRFVGDNPRSSQAIIQLDAKKSAFFPEGALLDFIMEFIGGRHPENDIPREMQRINKQVKNLSLQTIHLPETQITFCSSGLTDRPAQDIGFTTEGHQVNLVQYYQQKYGRRLQYPRLPCVIHRRGSNESFFPIEVLVIVEGQRVPLEKQTPKLTEQMIRQCQVLPAQLPHGIEKQRDEGMIQNANPFFKSHRIRVDTEMIRADAQQLFPPALVYNPPADRVEPDNRGVLDWRMVGRGVPQGRRYTVPCEFPRVWAVAIVQNAVSHGECGRFCEALVRNGQQRGIQMNMPPRVDNFEETSVEYVSEKFAFYAKHKCQFVLFFAPGKQQAHPGDVHHAFKLQEIAHNVLTQHISPQIMQKGISDRGAIMVLDNILMKTNLKMGGVNYDISTAQAFRQANRIQHDIIAEQFLGAKRMFFGIELSHAPPQTLYERRQNKAPANPTIVGMAYTVNTHMLQLNGTYWMQQPRVATVKQAEPMINAVKQALINYKTNSGHFPEHVFVFRAGASEGEYKKVAWWEGGAFDQAFNELSKSGQMSKRPALTIVVCQRQSNYRMVPKEVNPQGRAPDQNCQPGTVLDKGVMHSSLTEFLLIGHRTIQGTGQPVRCTVVVDTAQPRTSLNELEHITYALCYQHGICTSSTSVPGVLYSAGDLAKRGRNNWRTHTGDGETVQHFELPPVDQPEDVRAQAQAELDDQREQYYAHVSEELRPTIPTKFWA